MSNQYQIYPPYETFYIESMLTLTLSAIESTENLYRIFDPTSELSQISESQILNLVQNILTQSASLSRYFWTAKYLNKDKTKTLHGHRATYLRDVFEIEDSSPLKNRQIRDLIEHFDEQLDKFVNQEVIGHIFPNFVGREPQNNGVPVYIFRAFYTDTLIFEVIGIRCELQPIIDEVYMIHQKLVKFLEAGRMMKCIKDS